MTTDRAKAAPPGEPAELPSPISRALTAAALLLLVVSVTGRTMIGELPFRTAPLQPARMVAAGSPTLLPDTLEPARATFALLLLMALACGLGGQAALRRRPPWRPWLGGIAAFGVWATVSGLGGIDARAGLITAAEQTALLAAGYLAALLARDRQLRGLLLATLAAAGAAVAVRGLWQAYGESGIQRLETFQAYRTKAAELPNLIARLTEAAPWGFLGLANLFAALLVVLLAAATAIAAGKIARARARAASFAQTKGRAGEIDLAWVAAGLSALLAGVLAWVLWLTESRGAIAAAGIAAAAGVAVGLAGQRATRHRRGLLIAAGAAVLTAIAAVTAMGLARDGLPGKSMTFRWFYWTGAAEIIADRPLLGTGGGGFGPAYLAVRRPEAEEAVKNPHNWPLHAAGQFGIPGGLLFAAMVIGVLVTATRPGAPEPGGDRTGNETGAKTAAAADAHARPTALFAASLAVATAAALLVRWWDIHAFGDPALWMLESAIPAGAVAIGFLAACWCGGSWNPAALLAGRWGRIAVAAGLWAFAIHGLVSFGFWAPGVATAFWALAGVAVGGAAKPASARRGRDAPSAAALARTSAGGRVWRWLPAAAALAAAVAADLAVTAPAWRRYAAASEAAHEWAGRDWRRGLGALARAAEADPLDPTLPAEAARLHMATAPGLFAEYSLDLADEAVQRAPQEAWYHCLRAQCLWWLDEGPHLWRAPAPVAPLQVLRRQLASTPPGPMRDRIAAQVAEVRKMRLAEAALNTHRRDGDWRLALSRARRALESGETHSPIAHAQDALEMFSADRQGPVADGDLASIRAVLAAALHTEGHAERARQQWRQASAEFDSAAGQAIESMAACVRLDPMDMRRRLRLAEMLLFTGQPRPARQHLQAAMKVQQAMEAFGRRYPPPSDERLYPWELNRLALLEAWADALTPPPASAPTQREP